MLPRFAAALPLFLLSINSITPNIGTWSGGDVVRIELSDDFACPCEVRFGTLAATNVRQVDDDELEATTPTGNGTVDVSVTTNGTTLTLASAYTFVNRYSQFPPARENYVAVLVPLMIAPQEPVRGAYGSLWSSEFFAFNRNEARDVEFFAGYPLCAGPPGACASSFGAVFRGQTANLTPRTTNLAAAQLWYLQRSGEEDVSLSLRVRDLSRTTLNTGTEIPVVREHEFRRGAVNIVNVPLDDHSRAALRVYGVEGVATDAVVSIYPMSGGAAIASAMIGMPLPSPNANAFQAPFPSFAAYGIIGDLRAAFPSIVPGSYRVEVRLRDDAPGWAFVAVTNNETQLITAIKP